MSLPQKRNRSASWFQTLFGFDELADGTERRMAEIRKQFRYNAETGELQSLANSAKFGAGKFRTASVADLRVEALRQLKDKRGTDPDFLGWESALTVAYGDVADLMAKPEYYGAMFQVASQANFLEFVDPTFSAADGIENYCEDRTQGPASSIAAAPGTIVRNYFWDLETSEAQRHGLVDTLKEIGSDDLAVRAGFLLPKGAKVLGKINATLAGRQDAVKDTVRVGVQSNVQVTSTSWGMLPVTDATARVSQVFCYACPLAYDEFKHSKNDWALLGKLVLCAAYEAAAWAAVLQACEGDAECPGQGTLVLTLLGGGAFGNPEAWIIEAMDGALQAVRREGIALKVVLNVFSRGQIKKGGKVWVFASKWGFEPA